MAENTTELVAILPHIEQRALYDSFNFDFRISGCCKCSGDINSTARSISLSTYACPSDPVTSGRSSYRGVTGSVPFSDPDPEYNDGRLPDGPFYQGSAVPAAAFLDGMSSTVLFTERLKGGGQLDLGRTLTTLDQLGFGSGHSCDSPSSPTTSYQGMSYNGKYLSHEINFTRKPNARRPACLDAYQPSAVFNHFPFNATFDGPSSMHSGGVNMVMADGAVKFLRETVAPRTYTALATIAGGEPINDEEF